MTRVNQSIPMGIKLFKFSLFLGLAQQFATFFISWHTVLHTKGYIFADLTKKIGIRYQMTIIVLVVNHFFI